MTKTVVTSKNRTTVPLEIREKLGVGPGDILIWEIAGDHVRVTAANKNFLKLKGRFKVGPGDPVQDIRKARKLMGIKGL